MVRASKVLMVILLSIMICGCSVVLQRGRPSDVERISELDEEIVQLKKAREEEMRELNEAKRLLEERLKEEIGKREVRLEMLERGLVITFVAEVLFDSGKAKIRPEAYEVLDKVARVLREDIEDRCIGVDGHTDNEPIKYSKWRSNWELSTARATSVLHYFVDKKGVSPERISATGYGEFRPIATNETPEGRQINRRVEVVILPKEIVRLKAEVPEPEILK